MNHTHCERAHAGPGQPCATRLSWQQAGSQSSAAIALSPQARAWIAGVPWYEGCVAHAWANRPAAPAGTAVDLLQSVAAVRRCCECLLWGDAD